MYMLNPETQQTQDLISKYIDLVSDTEVPKLFHRWSILAGIGAILGRRVWVDAGIDLYYPNLYVMFVAPPGTKKSTAIKIVKRFLKKANYVNFSAERTTKEKFLIDLASGLSDGDEFGLLDKAVFADLAADGDDRETFITADEFTNFFGNNILEFVSLLGELWDYKGEYTLRVKNSESVIIPNPYVSILSGCTPETMHSAFPASVIGQGFFSRLLFVYAKGTDKSIAFPTPMNEDIMDEFATELLQMRAQVSGEIKLTSGARKLLEEIYSSPHQISDSRFTYYAARRFPQLLKLCLIHAVADFSEVIDTQHVRRANTILYHTEYYMPRALGALGRAADSEVSHKVVEIIEANPGKEMGELWKYINHDLREMKDLATVIQGLLLAEKIFSDQGRFYCNHVTKEEPDTSHFDWDYLTDEERGL